MPHDTIMIDIGSGNNFLDDFPCHTTPLWLTLVQAIIFLMIFHATRHHYDWHWFRQWFVARQLCWHCHISAIPLRAVSLQMLKKSMKNTVSKCARWWCRGTWHCWVISSHDIDKNGDVFIYFNWLIQPVMFQCQKWMKQQCCVSSENFRN